MSGRGLRRLSGLPGRQTHQRYIHRISGEQRKMSTASTLARYTALAVGIVGALAVGQAQAATFLLKENSANGLGRAFAVSTIPSRDPSLVGTNPASLLLPYVR